MPKWYGLQGLIIIISDSLASSQDLAAAALVLCAPAGMFGVTVLWPRLLLILQQIVEWFFGLCI
jgi:hypothetical protein